MNSKILSLIIIASLAAVVILPGGDMRQLFWITWLIVASPLAWSQVFWGRPLEKYLLGFSWALLGILVSILLATYLFSIWNGKLSSFTVVFLAIAWCAVPLAGRRPAGMGLQKFYEQITDWRQIKRRFRSILNPAFILVGVGLLLRLPGLGYKEIQGDESVALMRAAQTLLGNAEVLFVHQKGPIEILLPMASWSIGGPLTDGWLRAPVIISSLISILLFYRLAARWFNEPVGLTAGFLCAIFGFGVAFGRILQYQTFVILWILAALLLAELEPARDESILSPAKNRRSVSVWLHSSRPGFFLAGALLAHYDALLFFPAAAAALLNPQFFRPEYRGRLNAMWGQLAPSLLVGGGTAAVFYIPFAIGPTFQDTLSYLAGDRVGLTPDQGLTGSQLSEIWRMMTFYNGFYFIVGVIGLAIFGSFIFFARPDWRSKTPPMLFWLVPLVFYGFVVADSRTHIYTFFLGALVFASLGLNHLVSTRPGVLIRLGFAGWLALSSLYVLLLFTDYTSERQRRGVFPAHAITPWETPPQFGLFGFPYQAGWRAAADYISQNFDSEMTIGSNEEREITRWYLPEMPRTHCASADIFIEAWAVQDDVYFDDRWVADKQLSATIEIFGQPKINIYSPHPSGTPEILAGESARHWVTPQMIIPEFKESYQPAAVRLGETITLEGYKFDSSRFYPGGSLKVVLFWRTARPLDRNYQAFVHLVSENEFFQDDGAPDCAIRPTTGWEPGELIRDEHVVEIPKSADSEETFSIIVGLYDLITLDRLVTPAGQDVIHLGEISLKEP